MVRADTCRFPFRGKGSSVHHSYQAPGAAGQISQAPTRQYGGVRRETRHGFVATSPNLHKDMGKLEAFVAMLDRWPQVRHAIEFRDRSWFDEEVAALIARERIAVCQSDAASWPLWDAITTDLVFVRLHGHESTYSSSYGRQSLQRWAHRIDKWLSEGRDVHVYFDNDAKGYAPWNAVTLAEIIGLGRNAFDKSDFLARHRIRAKAGGQQAR